MVWCKANFNILNRLCMTHECDGWTGILLANAALSYPARSKKLKRKNDEQICPQNSQESVKSDRLVTKMKTDRLIKPLVQGKTKDRGSRSHRCCEVVVNQESNHMIFQLQVQHFTHLCCLIHVNKEDSRDATPSKCLPLSYGMHTFVHVWPLPLTSDLENLLNNAHSPGEYLCQVSLKFRHQIRRYYIMQKNVSPDGQRTAGRHIRWAENIIRLLAIVGSEAIINTHQQSTQLTANSIDSRSLNSRVVKRIL